MLRHYEYLVQLDFFTDFTVFQYVDIVQEQLKSRISSRVFSESSKRESAILFQNLTIIAFTLERWAQYVLKHALGQTVREVYLHLETPISIHDFLVQHVGNYNTLERFGFQSMPTLVLMSYLDMLSTSPIIPYTCSIA